jgi:hypothetical protein
MILGEKPLFVVRKPHEEITEGDVQAAFQLLASGEKEQFLSLRDNASRLFRNMSEAFAENSFAISTEPPTHGLFPLLSRFNHSCVPNSKVPTTSEMVVKNFAAGDILAGEEITFCYNTDFESRTRYERHRALRFVCDCKACLIGTRFQQLSDLRRRLIRGLQYLSDGTDLPEEPHCHAWPVIVDSRRRKEAENFDIPLSARFIYQLLAITLLQDEGLLDDFMIERLNPGVWVTASLFQKESNTRVVRQALAQKTWLGKFCVAWKLYGQRDAADHTVAELLRLLHQRKQRDT